MMALRSACACCRLSSTETGAVVVVVVDDVAVDSNNTDVLVPLRRRNHSSSSSRNATAAANHNHGGLTFFVALVRGCISLFFFLGGCYSLLGAENGTLNERMSSSMAFCVSSRAATITF